MSHKKRTHQNTHRSSSRENKRAQFAAPSTSQEEEAAAPRAGDKTKILFVVMAALIGVVAYLVMSGLDDRTTASAVRVSRQASAPASASQPASAEVSADAGGDVVIPISQLSGKASFFEYQTASGKDVRFFAMKSSDGVYRAALDSCDVCFAAKKGYHQEGDDMVCNKCGNHFHSSQINEVRGGCNPVGVGRTVAGDRLVIKASDLEAGVGYF